MGWRCALRPFSINFRDKMAIYFKLICTLNMFNLLTVKYENREWIRLKILYSNFLFIHHEAEVGTWFYIVKTAIQAEICVAKCLKCGAFCSAIQWNSHPVWEQKEQNIYGVVSWTGGRKWVIDWLHYSFSMFSKQFLLYHKEGVKCWPGWYFICFVT